MSFGFSPSDVLKLVEVSTRVYLAFKGSSEALEILCWLALMVIRCERKLRGTGRRSRARVHNVPPLPGRIRGANARIWETTTVPV